MNKVRLIQEGLNADGFPQPDIGTKILFYLQNADNMVNGSLVDRKTAVIIAPDDSQNFFLRHIDIDSVNIHNFFGYFITDIH